MRKLLSLLLLISGVVLITSFNTVKADTASGTSFSLKKDVAPSTVSPSGTTSFSITIKNINVAGGQNVTPQLINDIVPAGFGYIPGSSKLTNLSGTESSFEPSNIAGQSPAKSIQWTFAGSSLYSIPPQENIVITYSLTAPTTPGNYTNEACLTQSTPQENICAKASITVQSTTIPNTGLKENILMGTVISGGLAIAGMLVIKRKQFEDKF